MERRCREGERNNRGGGERETNEYSNGDERIEGYLCGINSVDGTRFEIRILYSVTYNFYNDAT
jgi:hypothetical protein